jgi:stress response protein YsnF
VDDVPPVRQEGDVTIVPVVEEILVVERRLVLKEEVRIRRVERSEKYQDEVTLHKQEAVVSRLEPEGLLNADESDSI